MPVVADGSALAFPCDFPIKVMGRKEPRFAQTVMEIVLKHAPDFDAATMEMRPSVDNGIPVVQADRGGEITYHGPGQVVLYALVDLARRGIKVKQFVAMLESSVIELLAGRGERKPGAPGVYVGGAKIAALGIRVSRGRAYHGLALNVDMDLAPFRAIDPCGCPGLAVTQTRDLGIEKSTDEIGAELAASLAGKLEHA